MGTKTRQNGVALHGERVRKALHQQGNSQGGVKVHVMGKWTASKILRHEGRSPCVVQPSHEGMMAGSRECYNHLLDSRSKKAWRDKHVCVLGKTNHGYRVFALVEVRSGDRSVKFLMDARTGTFYDPETGFCHTSENERIHNYIHVDDIKPFLRPNAYFYHLSEQWGSRRYGRNHG